MLSAHPQHYIPSHQALEYVLYCNVWHLLREKYPALQLVSKQSLHVTWTIMLTLGPCSSGTYHRHAKVWPYKDVRPILYVPLNWGAAQTLRISTNRIAQFHQIRTNGFIHPSLRNVTLSNVTPSLISYMCLVQISLLVLIFSSHTSWVLTLKQSTKEIKPQARTHYVVVIVIIAMLTLFYSIMSNDTSILYYNTSKLTLQTSLIPHALWLPHA